MHNINYSGDRFIYEDKETLTEVGKTYKLSLWYAARMQGQLGEVVVTMVKFGVSSHKYFISINLPE